MNIIRIHEYRFKKVILLCILIVLLVFFNSVSFAEDALQLPDARVGIKYRYGVTYTGLVEPVTVEWKGLPDGLQPDGAVFHGTPVVSSKEAHKIKVELTDQLERKFQKEYLLRVLPPNIPLAITTGNLPTFPLGHEVSVEFAAKGGEGSHQWSFEWLTELKSLRLEKHIDSKTIYLSGIPQSVGSFSFQIQVTDDMGTSDKRIYSGQVIPLASKLKLAELGEMLIIPYDSNGRIQYAAEGGNPPYKWSIKWMKLIPEKAEFDQNRGLLTLSSKSIGEYPYNVIVEDSFAQIASMSGTLVIEKPVCRMTINTDVLPDGIGGESYHASISTTGSKGEIDWTITGKPDWLIIQKLGGHLCLEGKVPDEGGQWDITTKVKAYVVSENGTDKQNAEIEIASSSKEYTLIAAPKTYAALEWLEGSPPSVIQDRAYSFRFCAAGGKLPLSYSYDNIPGWLRGDKSGLVSYVPSGKDIYSADFVVNVSSSDGQVIKKSLHLPVLLEAAPKPELRVPGSTEIWVPGYRSIAYRLPIQSTGQPVSVRITSIDNLDSAKVKDDFLTVKFNCGVKLWRWFSPSQANIVVSDSSGNEQSCTVIVNKTFGTIEIVCLAAALCVYLIYRLIRYLLKVIRKKR